MKKEVKKTDFYGITLFVIFIVWNIFSYFIFKINPYYGEMLGAIGLVSLLIGEMYIKYRFNDGEVIKFNRFFKG
ncbi:MAG: hypothetical protein RR561_01145 [Peptostreptococcus sp.]|uniref:hypothetical protein n=1 Tax=Peptostreptococcus sp. TaxID=1262 RepID=UPI002FCC05DA